VSHSQDAIVYHVRIPLRNSCICMKVSILFKVYRTEPYYALYFRKLVRVREGKREKECSLSKFTYPLVQTS